jgi:hypothetical protein
MVKITLLLSSFHQLHRTEIWRALITDRCEDFTPENVMSERTFRSFKAPPVFAMKFIHTTEKGWITTNVKMEF